MILYIIVAAVLLVNVINPRLLWYIDSWKYKSFQKEEPSSLYLFLCRLLSALGLMILILIIYFLSLIQRQNFRSPGSIYMSKTVNQRLIRRAITTCRKIRHDASLIPYSSIPIAGRRALYSLTVLYQI